MGTASSSNPAGEHHHRVVERDRAARQQVPGRERAPGELDCTLAVQPQPGLVMGHRREQDLAAEASVEGIQVELGDPCLGDRIGLRVPPRRADELRLEQLVEVRLSLLIDLVERLLEDRKGIRDPVREPERAAQLERDRAAPRRVGEELEAGPQVVGCGRAVRPPLRKAELDKHLSPCCRVSLLLERAGEIFDRGIGCALEEGALGRLAERRDHERVGLRGYAEKVACRTLRRGAGVEQQLRGQAVRGGSLDHIERLVDGAPDDGVEELERILATEEVEPNECGGGRTELACVHAGKSGRVAQLDPVAEDRGRAEEGERLRLQPSEAKPDGARNALRSDFQQTGRVLGGRADSLPCDRVEHRDDEERISARRRFERGGRRRRPAPSRAARARARRSRHARAVRGESRQPPGRR